MSLFFIWLLTTSLCGDAVVYSDPLLIYVWATATKVCMVKAMVFPVVMYGCESWTVKKADRKKK